MRIGRTTLAGVAGFAVMAVLAPAAWAAEGVTITQTDSPDPVDQGGTVTLQTTITNTGTAQSELRAHVRSLIEDQPAGSIAAAALGMAERPDSTPDLPGIHVPALVVTSSADALIPPEVTSPMAEQIPGAELVIIQGAGHLSNLEAPGEFNDLLEAHLRRSGIG